MFKIIRLQQNFHINFN